MAKNAIAHAICGLFLFLTSAQGEWQVASLDRKPCTLAGAEYRHYSLGEAGTGGEAEVQLIIFSPKNAELRVIDQPGSEKSLAAIIAREHAIAGVNGGYFDPEGAPVGLLRSAGAQISPLQKSRLLGGLIAVDSNNVKIFRTSEFSRPKSWQEALQCGPFLLDHGKTVTGLEKTRSARRTFAAITSDRRAALGFCDGATLAQLADLLGALSEIKITRALNLDGGSSSAFACRTTEGTIEIAERKNVRDFLIVVPATSR